MTQLEMNEFRVVLHNKRAALVYGNHRRGNLAIEASADEMDQTQDVQERDLAIETIDRDTRMLREVQSALERIGAGTFGICLDCEFDVGRKRLAAVPWAALCIVCQKLADSACSDSQSAIASSFVEVA